jgi:hypothetical protein
MNDSSLGIVGKQSQACVSELDTSAIFSHIIMWTFLQSFRHHSKKEKAST